MNIQVARITYGHHHYADSGVINDEVLDMHNHSSFKTGRFRRYQSGASAIEYALIVGLIAAAIVVAVTTLGEEIETVFENISNTLSGIGGGS